MILLSHYILTLKTVTCLELYYSEPPNTTFSEHQFYWNLIVKIFLTYFHKLCASWGCIFIVTPIITALIFSCCISLENSVYLNYLLYNVFINQLCCSTVLLCVILMSVGWLKLYETVTFFNIALPNTVESFKISFSQQFNILIIITYILWWELLGGNLYSFI